jgi:hypothetical protein
MGERCEAQDQREHPKDTAMRDFDFDVFISHASEDKSAFVTPLANALKRYGLRVWFDKFTLKVGDSLHDSIEKGLARSRYGVVVFSRKFLSKKWTREELNGLFARNLEGHKVILPVWHNLSAARMRSVLPMLADKVALRSSDGIEAVARSLVETIRPELLELDVRKESAFEGNESFIAEARRKYPGYDFAVHSGTMPDSISPETKFSIARGTRRIEIRVSDPSMMSSPPGGHVQFFGAGVKKAIEFQRTGKPQKWEPGEFALKDWNLPLMPPNANGSTMAVGELKLPKIPPRPIRVEVGSPPAVVFPIMEIRPVRLGTHESEIVLSDSESPLRVSIVFPIGSSGFPDNQQEFDLTLSWEETSGKRVSECKKLIEAIDALRRGEALRFIDIRLDHLIFASKANLSGMADPFGPSFRRTAFLASQIEEAFSTPLHMPEIISEEDAESLFHLDCLLNGCEYGRAANSTLCLIKTDGEVGAAQETFIRGECAATFTDGPSNYPGYFPLFSRRVATRDWVRVVEFAPAEVDTAVTAWSKAPVRSEITIDVTAKGPVYLRWREDSILKNIEVGKLAQSQP